MQEEYDFECNGIVGNSDKKNYMPMIGNSVNDSHMGSWDKCYEKIEAEIKNSEPNKDLSNIKKTLQEKGYVHVNNVVFGIGRLVVKN